MVAKKYNVNIKKMRKGKEGKVRVLCIHAFMHPHHIIPFFYHQKHILKSSKRKIRAHRGRFSVGLTLRLFQKAFMLCLSMLKSICRDPLNVDPLLEIGLIFSKRNHICKEYMFLDRGPLHGNGRRIL